MKQIAASQKPILLILDMVIDDTQISEPKNV